MARLASVLVLPSALAAAVCAFALFAFGGSGDSSTPPADTPLIVTSARDVVGLQVGEMLAYAAAAPPTPTSTPIPPAPPPRAPAPARQAQPPPPAPQPRPQIWTDASFSAAVLDVINGQRAAMGLPPVASDARLASAASSYALTMQRLSTVSHNADGTSADARVRAAGFRENVAIGEIIAMITGPTSAAEIVQLWMDSPPHRIAILDGAYRLAGAGCAFSATDARCVVEFAE